MFEIRKIHYQLNPYRKVCVWFFFIGQDGEQYCMSYVQGETLVIYNVQTDENHQDFDYIWNMTYAQFLEYAQQEIII